MMSVLDLFSGIGGFSLGLERAGMKTAAFCEIEPFCRAVLAKHWPGVPIYDDVRTLTAERLAADGISVDVICGGFPCQDISVAGKGAGLAGERSGLWREYERIISEVRPRWVIIENVPALRTRGLDTVLGSLAALGYDAEWHLIPASAIGAPHQRDRVWILAYPAIRGWREHGNECGQACDAGSGQPADCGADVADTGGAGLPGAECAGWPEPVISAAKVGAAASECSWRRAQSGVGGEADGFPSRLERYWPTPHGASGGGQGGTYDGHGNELSQAVYVSVGTSASERSARKVGSYEIEPWEGNTPRTVGRGYPNRRPRLKALGNSVVPQIPELIGRAILQAEARNAA